MAPQIVFPPPGSTLDGEIQVFRWDLGGVPVEQSSVYAGSSVGASDHGRRDVGADVEASLGGLPADRSPIFVRVWYRTNGVWNAIDASYTAASSAGTPAFIDPIEGASLEGSTQRFEWSVGTAVVDGSWLYVGSALGGSDYGVVRTSTGTSAPGSVLSTSVSGLPVGSQQTVFARLYRFIGGSWYSTDHTFQAALSEKKTKDELTRELQRLVGVTADGIIGPRSKAALNANWLGRPASFDPSFAARFTNDEDLIRWVQVRIVARGGPQVQVNGAFDATMEAAVASHLDRGGVVAAESFVLLLDP